MFFKDFYFNEKFDVLLLTQLFMASTLKQKEFTHILAFLTNMKTNNFLIEKTQIHECRKNRDILFSSCI